MIHWFQRLSEWRTVVWKERSNVSVRGLIVAALSGPVPREVWRQRMRTCLKCPIHARRLIRVNGVLTWTGLHACRAELRSEMTGSCVVTYLGCGCWTTALAITADPYPSTKRHPSHGGCWAHAITENEGWQKYEYTGRWAKLRAVWRFLFR